MMFTADNIDTLRARELHGGLWLVTFRSSNAGLCHQLYVDGVLRDCTESPQSRQFVVRAGVGPSSLAVLAVNEDLRRTDLSSALGAEFAPPPWVHRVLVAQAPPIEDGLSVALMGDHGAGHTDPVPLARRELWPAWTPRWAFGQDPMGAGGFGWDGSLGPGFGAPPMGAGPFGIGGELLELRAALESGTHTLLLRTLDSAGRHADSAPWQTTVAAPPRPARALAAKTYEPSSDTLVLEVTP